MKMFWIMGAECTGIKKRERKVKRHRTDDVKSPLGKVEVENSSEPSVWVVAEAKEAASKWVAENIKTLSPNGNPRATLTLWRENDAGFMEWSPFTKEENLKFAVEVAGAQ